MKANIKFGNILDAKGIIMQGCNAQGVMGSGLAKDIRNKWPEVFSVYADYINDKRISGEGFMGDAIPFVPNESNVVIMNCITQEFYGKYGQEPGKRYVSYKAIDTAFRRVYEFIKAGQMYDINYPLIGAGLANGDWSIISAIIDNVAAEEDPGNYIKRTLWIKE